MWVIDEKQLLVYEGLGIWRMVWQKEKAVMYDYEEQWLWYDYEEYEEPVWP